MQPGMTVGSYRILEQVGLGGMATVFKAFDPGMDRYVAVKIVSPQFAQHPEFRARFRREAKSIAKLEHPHIIPVHAYGEEGETAYLVLRFMQAGTLRDRMDHHPLDFEEAGRLLDQVASALDYAHRNGVIHRDVKPSNVMVDAEGNAYLTDFGIAKIVEATVELTGTGTAMGTPQYMSPEQCRGAKELTPASDIYSLGVMAYQMFTGRVPFEAETPLAVIFMHINDPLPPPRQINPEIPEALERTLLKALAKDPEDRYQSAAEFGARLRSTLREAAPPQPAPAAEEPSRAPQPLPAGLEPTREPTPELPAIEAPRTRFAFPAGLKRFWWVGALVAALALVGVFVVPRLGGPPLSPADGEAVATQVAALPEDDSAPSGAEAEAPSIVAEPPASGEIDCRGSSPGDRVRILHPWTEERSQQFITILEPLLDACGLDLAPEWMGDDAGRLRVVLSAPRPPNVVIWAGWRDLRRNLNLLAPLLEHGANPENYPRFWIEQGSGIVGQPPARTWVAAPLTVHLKSMIWYSPEVFETFGYRVPTSFSELEALVEEMVADGNVPWAMGFESGEATGWAGSDFIQDLILLTGGSAAVNRLIEGGLRYDTMTVFDAYIRYLAWAKDDRYTVGGAEGTLNTNFMDAIYQVVAEPRQAMMVYQAWWTYYTLAEQRPELEYGRDYEFFPFPGGGAVQGWAEWITLVDPTPASEALLAYLTSVEGAHNLASSDFGLSPNLGAEGAHPEPYLSNLEDMLFAARGFTPDLGDTIGTGAFAKAEWDGIVQAVGGQSSLLRTYIRDVAEVQAAEIGGP